MPAAPSNPQRGQMLIVVMMMITTVIIMFGMTVSVGHLVQSKVNLQNSVDLASLSAASYQARHMNSLSVANYRIRAVLKHFLLDSYVTQGRFNNKFRTDILGSSGGIISDPLLTFSVCQQAYNYRPTLSTPGFSERGRGVDAQTNLCRNFTSNSTPTAITPLLASPIPGFNALYASINIVLLQIADEFRQSCLEWSGQNGVWANWAVDRASRDLDEESRNMPRVVNQFQAAFGNGDVLSIQSGEASRSTLATFRSNLIGSLLAGGGAESSLVYLNEESERYVGLSDLQKSEKLYGLAYLNPRWLSGPGGCVIESNSGGARATARPMVQGYSKLRPIFASDNSLQSGKVVSVGLLANIDNSSILFWPQGLEPVLVAVAAAKPFGSRIGPPREYFDIEGGPEGWGNVATFPGDNAQRLTTGGFGHTRILRMGYSLLPAPGSGIGALRPKDAFAQMAYAPTKFDGMYYSIFDSFIGESSVFAPSDVQPTPPLSLSAPLLDRGGSLPDPYQWSQAPAMTPHYDQRATTSAWAPVAGERRSGYQIKMISIDDLCEVSNSSRLGAICNKEGVRLL